MSEAPTLYLTAGLPGSGKTTWATRLAREEAVIRLTPDDWMAPLFADSDAGGRRDVLEGRLIWVAHQALLAGASAVLDFGCWSPEERYAIRSVAVLASAEFVLRDFPVAEEERRARATRRWLDRPATTFPMTDADHDRFLAAYRPPSEAELTYAPIPLPPNGFESWLQWADRRWPTLGRLDLAGGRQRPGRRRRQP